jgi:hypothetical protein
VHEMLVTHCYSCVVMPGTACIFFHIANRVSIFAFSAAFWAAELRCHSAVQRTPADVHLHLLSTANIKQEVRRRGFLLYGDSAVCRTVAVLERCKLPIEAGEAGMTVQQTWTSWPLTEGAGQKAAVDPFSRAPGIVLSQGDFDPPRKATGNAARLLRGVSSTWSEFSLYVYRCQWDHTSDI